MHRHARHEVRRIKERAHYDRQQAYAVLDASWMAHVGFSVKGQPFVIPMLYARQGDALLLHGSIASRLQQTLGQSIEACVSVTILDGLVLARSHFHHSVNYRSVVAFGKAVQVQDPALKADALLRFVDALIPGRAAEARPADAQELAATSVLLFDIMDISAKIRSGGAKDNAADLNLPYWAGIVPIAQRYSAPMPAPDVAVGCALPAAVQRLLE